MKISLILIAILVFILRVETIEDTNYCEISHAHFLCNTYEAQNCNNQGTEAGFNKDEQEVIIQKHFDQRIELVNKDYILIGRRYLPCASNMNYMMWSDVLAKAALMSAKRCDLSNYSDHNRRKIRYYNEDKRLDEMETAETLIIHEKLDSFPEIDILRFMEDILSQKEFFKGDSHYTFGGYVPWDRKNKQRLRDHPSELGEKKSVIHFANLISADSYLIGCALYRFISSEKKYTNAYICHYGPAPGKTGLLYKHNNTYCPACADCLHGCVDYDKLCDIKDLPQPLPSISPKIPPKLTTTTKHDTTTTKYDTTTTEYVDTERSSSTLTTTTDEYYPDVGASISVPLSSSKPMSLFLFVSLIFVK